MDLWVEQALHPEGLATAIVIPLYSTEIAAAWMAVEWWQKTQGRQLDLRWSEYANDWDVGYNLDGLFFLQHNGKFEDAASGSTAPLAIARAALKAVDNQPKAE